MRDSDRFQISLVDDTVDMAAKDRIFLPPDRLAKQSRKSVLSGKPIAQRESLNAADSISLAACQKTFLR